MDGLGAEGCCVDSWSKRWELGSDDGGCSLVLANFFCLFLLVFLFVFVLVVWSVSELEEVEELLRRCLLYTSPSPRDGLLSRMPSSA